MTIMEIPERMQEVPLDPPEKPWWQRWLLLLFPVTIILCIAVCCIFPGILGGWLPRVRHAFDVSTRLIDGYMQAMRDKDVELALSFLAEANRGGLTRETLLAELEGYSYACYDGHEWVQIQAETIEKKRTQVGDPNTETLHVEGKIAYTKPLNFYQFEGYLFADLVKEDNQWKIDHIEIFVPPEKVERDR